MGYFAQFCIAFSADSTEQTVLCVKNVLVCVVIYKHISVKRVKQLATLDAVLK